MIPSYYIPPKYVAEMVYFGSISGASYSILFTILATWCTDVKIALPILTSLAITRMPYGFKFLWAPFIDAFDIPIISSIGRRKAWMLFLLVLQLFLLLLISKINPATQFNILLISSFALGFCSASFDIVFDAFRIDTLEDKDQGYAVSCVVAGFRLGGMIISVGMFYLSEYYDWETAFLLPAMILLFGIAYVPFLAEGSEYHAPKTPVTKKCYNSVVLPFYDFWKRKNIILILLAVILYKAGGVLLGFMSMPFFLKLGYSKIQIIQIIKTLGIIASIGGSFFGGFVVERIGLLRALIFCGIIQALVHSVYIWLNHAPVSEISLIIAVSIENFGSSAGTAAEIAYLSSLCNKSFSATQYALLTSLASLLNSLLTIKSGGVIELVGWDVFFIITVLISFPSLILFGYLHYKERKAQKSLGKIFPQYDLNLPKNIL